MFWIEIVASNLSEIFHKTSTLPTIWLANKTQANLSKKTFMHKFENDLVLRKMEQNKPTFL